MPSIYFVSVTKLTHEKIRLPAHILQLDILTFVSFQSNVSVKVSLGMGYFVLICRYTERVECSHSALSCMGQLSGSNTSWDV